MLSREQAQLNALSRHNRGEVLSCTQSASAVVKYPECNFYSIHVLIFLISKDFDTQNKVLVRTPQVVQESISWSHTY